MEINVPPPILSNKDCIFSTDYIFSCYYKKHMGSSFWSHYIQDAFYHIYVNINHNVQIFLPHISRVFQEGKRVTSQGPSRNIMIIWMVFFKIIQKIPPRNNLVIMCCHHWNHKDWLFLVISWTTLMSFYYCFVMIHQLQRDL